jgi:hypothetical protein
MIMTDINAFKGLEICDVCQKPTPKEQLRWYRGSNTMICPNTKCRQHMDDIWNYNQYMNSLQSSNDYE